MTDKTKMTQKMLQPTDTTATDVSRGIVFNANNDTDSYGNCMSGHANGSDIHPYSIELLPILVY